MGATITNRAARSLVLAGLVALGLCAAAVLDGRIAPNAEGWALVTLAAIFVISEAFFWRAIEGVSALPASDSLSIQQAETLARRIQELKRRLTGRWFLLLGLKVVAGICGIFLTNEKEASVAQRIAWLTGVGALIVSLPLLLSFFRIWQQIKSEQVLDDRRQKVSRGASEALAKEPAKPLRAEKALKGYTTIVRSKKGVQ